MTTIVLVHGGGHGGWCWAPVRRLLQAAGHEVFAPTLSGLGDRAHLLSPDLGLETHINDICGLLAFEDLGDVILVGHSYGGMVVTGAADRAHERIGHLVYLDAAIPRDGEALLDISPGLLSLAGTTRFVHGCELGLWPDESASAIYGLDDCPLKEWAVQRLTPHPWKTVTDRLHLRNADRLAQIPRTIINCAATLTKRPQSLRHRWQEGARVVEIEADHDLMLTEPAKVCEMLVGIADSHCPA